LLPSENHRFLGLYRHHNGTEVRLSLLWPPGIVTLNPNHLCQLLFWSPTLTIQTPAKRKEKEKNNKELLCQLGRIGCRRFDKGIPSLTVMHLENPPRCS
jgi:hypothetical protein